MTDPYSGGPREQNPPLPMGRGPRPPALALALAGRLAAVPGVVAVVVAGSRATGTADDGSDLDLYVYAASELPLPVREAVAGPDATNGEFDMRFWEPGDAWTDRPTGLTVDITYRTVGWLEAELDRVLVRHEASVGYSTAVWHNVLASLPLADSSGWFARARATATGPYPEPLRRAIIAKNLPLLRGSRFSFPSQIEDAVRRGDVVATQHRLTALLASYFDVLFGLNRQTHPGEKRLVALALATCPLHPPDFGPAVDAVVAASAAPWGDGRLEAAVRHLVDGLTELLIAEGLV